MSLPEHNAKDIFAEALRLTNAAERAAYVAGACADNPALRHEVESLLAAYARAGDFLEHTIPLPASDFLIERTGTMIGRYKLLQKIGEGGFGVVYMAEQVEPVQRKVALKIIKAGMDTKEVIARFEAERQALALMDHPGIANILDGGSTEAGRPYFVMELVNGIPITEYCDQKKLPTAERLQLFMKVCHAVQHAHQKGIIHRDLKPSNVLVTLHDGEPVPKVIDFGVAKALGQKLTQKTLFTAFQHMIGTPAYMSPEQAELSGLDIDTRSDIYSLGVLLYELLTGVTPFDKETLARVALDELRRMFRETEPSKPSTRLQTLGEKLTEVAQRRHTEPTALRRLLRGDLDWIVMKCLEKDRKRRYETPDALAMDVARHLNQEPVTAAAPDAFYLAGKFVRRHKAGLATATALTLALVAGLVVSLWQAGVLRQAQRSAEAARQKEAQMRQRAEQEELNARRNLYAADMKLAKQALEEGNWGRARTLLLPHRPEAGQQDLRGFEWRYLWGAARGDNFATFRGHSNVVTSVAVSPDGKTVLSGSWDQTVRMWDFASGVCVGVLPRFRGAVHSVAFSPDGKLFAVGSSEGASLWRTETRERLSVLGGKHSRVAFSPVGTLIAFGTTTPFEQLDGRPVTLVDYSTGEQVAKFPDGGTHANFSPDGKLLALAGRNDGVRIWDIGSRHEVGVLRKADQVRYLAFSPDSRNLVASYWGGDLCVWDVASQRIRASLAGHALRVLRVAFSPDGHTMASASSDQTVRLWDLATWKTGLVLHGHGNEIFTVAFTPDGRTLVTGSMDETIMLWPVMPARPAEVIREIWSPPRISSDGSTLAALGGTGKVTLWDLPGRRLTTELPSRDLPLGFLPDGRLLVTLGGSGVLTVWDTSNSSVQSQTKLPGKDPITWAVLSPDGQTVATGNTNDRVRFWNTRTGAMRGFVNGHNFEDRTLAFSPDSRRFVSVRGGTASIWDVASFRRLPPVRQHKQLVWTCAWSPDGKLLATGSTDGTTTLWDASTGKDLATLTGEMQVMGAAAFSRDGRTLATCGSKGVRLWNLATQRDVATLTFLESPSELLFAPNDRELLVGCSGGIFHLFHAPPFEEIEASK